VKISIIGTVGVPACYGGFETLAERLVDAKDAKFTVYCSKKHYKVYPEEYKTADLVYLPFDANGVSSVIYDIFSMLHALISGHRNFLVLGVSGAIFFPILSCFPKVKIITNIDGIEWRREKWKGLAKVFLKFSEYLAVRFSSQVVSDNDAITRYISEEYLSKCETIAYGGDHAFRPRANVKIHNKFDASSPFALSICRIEPENNVHLILEAFSEAKLRLVFIGNWKKTSYGRALYSKYKNNVNIVLSKPIYCLDTLHAYRSECSVYIHGHSAGGTNPSLVEMMHFSKPIVAFECAFNRATMEGIGNYFSSSEGLIKCLDELNGLTDGIEMNEIAKRRYTWEIVRTQYLELFRYKETN
jgi:glycosyltransferase involved in cell wall biosynthesis